MPHTRASYNFVPLNSNVTFPDWADKVSHDVPLKDGYCGTVDLTFTAKTKLLVGGDRTKSTGETIGEVKMFVTPAGDKSYAIPGSSIRGMIRNVIEIASFGKMHLGRVNDTKPWVRDLNDSQYKRCIITRQENRNFVSKAQAGYLYKNENNWTLVPCRYARIEHTDLQNFSQTQNNKWPSLTGTAIEKYKSWVTAGNNVALQNLNYEEAFSPPNSPIEFCKATFEAQGHGAGQLVFTNQVEGKHREFVFYNPNINMAESSAELNEAVKDFLEFEGHKDLWEYLKANAEISKAHGVPVFFIGPANAPRAIGLTQMIKIRSPQSIHDKIKLASKEHFSADRPDLAELIFGHLGNDQNLSSLKSRAHFGLATVKSEPNIDGNNQNIMSTATILGQPRSTFYPHYLEQGAYQADPEKINGNTHNSYLTQNSEIRGWKRYPARSAVTLAPIPEDNENLDVRVTLEQIPADTVFENRLHIHNMNAIEIGALLWALDFGGRENSVHTLGMGKPFGMGTVSIKYENSNFIANDTAAIPLTPADCVQAFRDWIRRAVEGWNGSGQLKELLAMADPTYGDTVHQSPNGNNNRLRSLTLEPHNEFNRVKKDNLKLRRHSEIATVQDNPPEAEGGALAIGDWVEHPQRPVTGQIIEFADNGFPVVQTDRRPVNNFPSSAYIKINPPAAEDA